MLTMQSASVVLTIAHRLLRRAATRALWTIFAAQLGIGIANAFNAPAFQASMPLLVHRQDLPGRDQPQLGDDQRHPRDGPGRSRRSWPSPASACRSIFLVNAATYLFFIAALLIVRMPDVRSGNTARRARAAHGRAQRSPRNRLVLNRLLLGMFLVLAVQPRRTSGCSRRSPPQLRHRTRRARPTAGCTRCGVPGRSSARSSVGTFLSSIDRRVLIVRGFTGFAICLAVFSQLRGPVLAVPRRLRARLLLLHDRDGDHDDVPAEHEEHRAGDGDAAVVHGVRRHGADRQPAVRCGDRMDRRPRRARLRCGVRAVPRLVGRPATPASDGVPRRGRRRRTVHPDERHSTRPDLDVSAAASAELHGRTTIRSRPAARLAFTSTTSPAPSRPSAATGSSIGRRRRRGRCRRRSTSTPSSAARSATARCAGAGSSSSAISPSTAKRRSAAIAASASSAASIEVGLAL